jgi:hypothetical protein
LTFLQPIDQSRGDEAARDRASQQGRLSPMPWVGAGRLRLLVVLAALAAGQAAKAVSERQEEYAANDADGEVGMTKNLSSAASKSCDRRSEVKKTMFLGMAAALAMISAAKADPVPLSAYVDQNGYIDVIALTCAQLANTYQEDANVLTAWYSGWYNGLDHKHYLDYTKGRIVEHDVIEYCKAHPDEKIIHAMAVVLNDVRRELGIDVK